MPEGVHSLLIRAPLSAELEVRLLGPQGTPELRSVLPAGHWRTVFVSKDVGIELRLQPRDASAWVAEEAGPTQVVPLDEGHRFL